MVLQTGDLDDAHKSTDGKYHLKVEVKGTHMKYWINNQVIYDGEQDFFTSGYLGLDGWNANVAFTNIKFTDGTIGTAVTVTTGAAVKLTAPVTGETPVSTIADTDKYTATIQWEAKSSNI